MLINPKSGSYFLLGEVLLDLKLEPDPPFVTDHCGTCTRCIDACPTQAILEDRFLDARKCISYLTIETRGSLEADLRPKVGDWVFGCDICQAVCPWNRFALNLTPDPTLSSASLELDLIHELELTEEGFKTKFKESPIRRSKRQGYLRNVALALGNSQNKSVVPVLTQRLEVETDEVVREALAWAITQLANVCYRESARCCPPECC
jgi:epoxyqueuosine reductase